MNTLIINSKEFNQQVWQTETGFTNKQYNEWLHGTANKLLKDIYYNDFICGMIETAGLDIYILGDIINMIDNIKIKKG